MSDFQEIANFAHNCNKFMKLNHKSGSSGQNFGKLEIRNNENKPQSSKDCFECLGRGHKAFECSTRMKRLENDSGNKKGMHAILSDNEENTDTQQESHDYVVFIAQVSLE